MQKVTFIVLKDAVADEMVEMVEMWALLLTRDAQDHDHDPPHVSSTSSPHAPIMI